MTRSQSRIPRILMNLLRMLARSIFVLTGAVSACLAPVEEDDPMPLSHTQQLRDGRGRLAGVYYPEEDAVVIKRGGQVTTVSISDRTVTIAHESGRPVIYPIVPEGEEET